MAAVITVAAITRTGEGTIPEAVADAAVVVAAVGRAAGVQATAGMNTRWPISIFMTSRASAARGFTMPSSRILILRFALWLKNCDGSTALATIRRTRRVPANAATSK